MSPVRFGYVHSSMQPTHQGEASVLLGAGRVVPHGAWSAPTRGRLARETGRSGTAGRAAGGGSPMGTRRLSTARQAVDKNFFDEAESEPEPRWVEVNAAGVRVENCRQFGGPWLALELVRRLQLDEFLQREIAVGPRTRSLVVERADSRDCPTPGSVQRTVYGGAVVSEDRAAGTFGRAGRSCRRQSTVPHTGRIAATQGDICRFISSSGWENCSPWNTTSCCTM